MAIRVKHRVYVHTYEDTAGKNKLFAPDPELSEVVNDGFDKQAGGVVSVAVSSNEGLSLGDLTAVKGLFLRVNGDAQVILNGGDAIQMRKGPSGSTARLFIEADITSINVANPSATDVLNGVYCIWGDPSA